MRSLILTAAIAAALVSTSLTVGYAASSAKPGAPGAHAERGMGESNFSGKSDAVPSVNYPKQSMATYPMAGYAFHWGTRLSAIDSELSTAARHIRTDRRRGYLTPAEASILRSEDRAIRTTAADIAARNGGMIPTASYVMLRERVAGLNDTIHHYMAIPARA